MLFRAEFNGQLGEAGFVSTVPQSLALMWLQYVLCSERRRMLEGLLGHNERALVDLLAVRFFCCFMLCFESVQLDRFLKGSKNAFPPSKSTHTGAYNYNQPILK
jgi:hypothetical protein